jgi:predicted RNase H-like HicB family nuclease
MQYPICIEWGDDFTATGIQIPDIPGAATAGDSFEVVMCSMKILSKYIVAR